jgi:ATP phosphoribosyltransferase
MREMSNGARPHSARKASLTTAIGGHSFTVKLLKVQDVAALLREGMVDFGVCSDEWMSEFRVGVPNCLDLDWCLTRIVFATPERSSGRRRFLRVATPYPNLAHAFLERRGLPYRVLPVFGCPEALVPDICDAVIDCVETGRSLRENGLVEREVLLESTVRLYLQPHHEGSEAASALATMLGAHSGADGHSLLASLVTP